MTCTYDLTIPHAKIAQDHQFPATPEALATILAQYQITPTHIQRLGGGFENETFRITCARGSYVLRVYRRHRKQPARIYQELDFMTYLLEHDVPVPHIIQNRHHRILSETTFQGATWHSIMMREMSGQHPTYDSPQLLQQMARLQARIHLLGYQYAKRTHMHKSWFTQPTLWPKGMVHFDFTADNILYAHQRISAVLDFDDMAYAPLITCLIITLVRLPKQFQTPQVTRAYLAAYETIRHLSLAERAYLKLTLSAKRLRYRLTNPVSRTAA